MQGTCRGSAWSISKRSFKAAEAAVAAAEAERDRGVVRAPWSASSPTSRSRSARRPSRSPREIVEMVALDPMLAVVEVAERKLAGVKVGDGRDAAGDGETATGRIRFVSKSAARPRAPTGSRSRSTMRTARSRTASPPRWRSRSRRRRDARAALGADLLVEGRTRRAHGRRRRQGRVRAGVGGRGRADLHVVSTACRRRAVIVQGQDFVREGQRSKRCRAEPPQLR